MSKRDHYEVLGVPRSATEDQIKRAYRELSKKYHPDRNPNDPSAEGKFKDVQHAYGVLKDPAKRSEYDRFGDVGVGNFETSPQGRRVYSWGDGSAVNVEDLEDLFSAFGGNQGAAPGERPSIFEQVFGGPPRGGGRRTAGPSRPQPQRGTDEEKPINLTLKQAVEGASVTLRLRIGDDGRQETLEVKVPPGVKDGQRIRLEGRGRDGAGGGPPGDLYLVCSVAPHQYFRRDGADIYLDVPVTISEAALGARLEVPTIDGHATVTLPPGTPSGSKLRLRGKGGPRPHGKGHGDQYIVIQIVPPRELTDEQRRLIEEFRRTGEPDPRATAGW